MPRYINLDELLTAIDRRNGRLPLWLDEILMEDCKVADVEPVVRCKDCTNQGQCSVEESFILYSLPEEKRFCGNGKRKENNNDKT